MKKTFSLMLALLLVLCMATLPVCADLADDIDDLRIPGDLVGSAVDVPTDMQVSVDDNGLSNSQILTGYTEPEAELDFEATIDMEPVRAKYLDYVRYSESLVSVGLTAEDLKKVTVDGTFEVYIKMSEAMGEAVEALTADIATNPVINPADDMDGFTLVNSNGVVVTDVYTEGSYDRTWEQLESGEYLLGIKLDTKSPTGNGALTAGDLMTGVTAPYATLDYNTYLGDVKFNIEGVVLPVAALPYAETVWGYIEGVTVFNYLEDGATEPVEITKVQYESVQEEGREDGLVQWKPEYEEDAVKSKRVSTTVEFRTIDQIKLTFVVNGTYLVPPAESGVEYTDVIAPVYGDTEIAFDASEYKVTKDDGKRTKYSFKGWSLTPDGEVIGDETFREDTTLYAVFTETSKPTTGGGPVASPITINFVISGDSTIIPPISGYPPQSVELSELAVPEVEGFIFDGWYTDGTYNHKAADLFKTSVSTTLFGRYVKKDVPPALDGESHIAYVIGYPEGDVRPENNISREEVTTIFYRLLKKDVRDGIFTDENSFSDVADDRWSNKAISTMAKGGYVKGYDDGTFLPEAYITRAEFVTMAARFLEGKATNKATFSDIADHWAKEYIEMAAGSGWTNGYEDGTFKPDNYITRAEAMAIINRILVRYVNGEGVHADAKKWPDNPANAWYYYDVIEATNAHEYTRQADGIHESWAKVNENNVWAEKPKYEDAE